MSRSFCVLAAAGTLLVVARVGAITWDFADGDQGWHARDGQCVIGIVSCAPLRSVVADGVWRVTPLLDPSVAAMVELVSPRLDQPAALFDRLEIRFRVAHPDPFLGQLGLYWEAASDEGGTETTWSAQLYEPRSLFTGEWQTLTITGLPEHAMTTLGAWSGVLHELRLRLVLSEGPVATAEGMPELVEIDRIRLTGVEEQLGGELPPPDPGAAYWGTYFEAPRLYALRRGAGEGADSDPGAGALVDLDGDGWLDVLAGGGQISGGGWMYALGDGAGGFGPVRVEMLGVAGDPAPDRAAATDLNGDGWVDVMVMDAPYAAQVLYSAGDGSWDPGEALPGYRYLGAGDMDGDGDEDLWFLPDGPLAVEVLVAGEPGGLRRERFVMQPASRDPELTPCPRYLAGNLSGSPAAAALVNAPRYLWPDQSSTSEHAPFTGYSIVRWLDGGFEQEPIAIAAHPGLIKSIGDLDQDGDLDFVLGNEMLIGPSPGDGLRGRGLTLVLAEADGSYRSLPWLDTPVTRRSVQELKWTDFDGDGVLDVAFPDRASTGPAVMVCLGQADGNAPVLEGRYELGGTPEEVFTGDVDNDGDQDVVVLESTHGQDGGVEVFLNLAGNRSTAVCDRAHDALPAAPRLGPCYPNPFNAGTVIPLTVPAAAGIARLSIYNLLGQRVRTLVDGPLSPGIHAIRWDGCDSQGASAGSGTYLCRLEVAGQEQSLRLTKLE